MKIIYALGAILVLAGGIELSLYLGDQPESTTRIPYKTYSTAQNFIEVLLEKLNKPLSEAPLLLLGVNPGRPQDLQLWQTFLAEAKKRGSDYSVVVIDPNLPRVKEFFPSAVAVDIKNERERFLTGYAKALKLGKSTAVITASIYAAQSIQEGPANKLKEAMKGESITTTPPLSLSLVTFPRAPSEEDNLEWPCKVADQNREGTGALGCLIQSRARSLYKQPRDLKNYEGLVDQVSERDFLVFWNTPTQ